MEEDFYTDDQPDIKKRQDNFNSSHLFGTKPWKSALYKKARSISRIADDNVLGLDPSSPNSTTSRTPSTKLKWKNIIYTVTLGWLIALFYGIAGMCLIIMSFGKSPFIPIVFQLMKYNFYPFRYRIERVLNGRFTNEEMLTDSVGLLNGTIKASIWETVSYTFIMCLFVYPLHCLSWVLCYLSVYYIPMGKLSSKLMRNILLKPLMLNVNQLTSNDASRLLSHSENLQLFNDNQTILIASIHIAADVKYFKYTVDGVNIMFINFIPIVLFTLFNGYFLGPLYHFMPGITSRFTIFFLCIFSSVPLSYFLGLGIASISAQSSFGFGAVVNASFGSIIEILLYCIALNNKKGLIVQGSVIGSFLAVLLLLPGLSMIFGGIKYKELKFNVKSTGVTTTMLIMSIITLFTPTFFQLSFPKGNPQPLTWICCIVMPLAYCIGLLFTLKTHVRHIYEMNYTVSIDHTIPNVPIPTVTLTPSVSDDEDHSQPQVMTDLTIPNRPRARSTSVSVHHDLHDAPNWSVFKSTCIIICCTILFTFIAELLVDCVDVVLHGTGLSQKFIGITLFALVPSVPEFVNAILFALQGHVDLSLEIGLAYTVQVALLQIPCVLLFSGLRLFLLQNEPTPLNSFT